MTRTPYPHEPLIHELREIFRDINNPIRYSDDTDQWYEGTYGYSPIREQDARAAAGLRRAEQIAQELVALGPAAAEAVCYGLRLRGQFREYLVPFIRKYPDIPVVERTMEMIRRRKSDWLHRFGFTTSLQPHRVVD